MNFVECLLIKTNRLSVLTNQKPFQDTQSAMKSVFSVHSGGIIDLYIKLSAFLDE